MPIGGGAACIDPGFGRRREPDFNCDQRSAMVIGPSIPKLESSAGRRWSEIHSNRPFGRIPVCASGAAFGGYRISVQIPAVAPAGAYARRLEAKARDGEVSAQGNWGETVG